MQKGTYGHEHNEVLLMQLSTIMIISTILTCMAVLLIYPRIRSITLITTKAQILVLLGIAWLVLWFVMCYIVAIGMYLIEVVI